MYVLVTDDMVVRGCCKTTGFSLYFVEIFQNLRSCLKPLQLILCQKLFVEVHLLQVTNRVDHSFLFPTEQRINL